MRWVVPPRFDATCRQVPAVLVWHYEVAFRLSSASEGCFWEGNWLQKGVGMKQSIVDRWRAVIIDRWETGSFVEKGLMVFSLVVIIIGFIISGLIISIMW